MNPPGTQAVRPLTVLSEEETLFRTVVHDYAATTIAPLVSRMDEEAQYDPALIPGLFDLGVMGVEIPEQYGGPGSSFFIACLAVEEISRVDAAVGVLVDVHNTLVTNALLRWGTPAQYAAFFPKLVRHTVGAYALSEAGSGSDAFALQTRATLDGDHYVLNGRKLWTSNGREADSTSFLPPLIPVRATGVLRRSSSNAMLLVLLSDASKRSSVFVPAAL